MGRNSPDELNGKPYIISSGLLFGSNTDAYTEKKFPSFPVRFRRGAIDGFLLKASMKNKEKETLSSTSVEMFRRSGNKSVSISSLSSTSRVVVFLLTAISA